MPVLTVARQHVEGDEQTGVFYAVDPALADQIRRDGPLALAAQYPAGRYHDQAAIRAILNALYDYHGERCAAALAPIVSVRLLAVLMQVYDAFARWVNSRREGRLSAVRSLDGQSVFQRATKHLAEQVLLQAGGDLPAEPTASDLDRQLQEAYVCAAERVRLYAASSQTYVLFPDNTTLTLDPQAADPWQLALAGHASDKLDDYSRRIEEDRHRRDREFDASRPKFAYDQDAIAHNDIIAEDVRKRVGVDYESCLVLLECLGDSSLFPQPGAGTAMFRRSDVVDTLWRWSRQTERGRTAINATPEAIERVLDGFVLTAANMRGEGRDLWKPLQQYRARRRGVFQFPYGGVECLLWSEGLRCETMGALMEGVSFDDFPSEWLASKKEREKLGEFTRRRGKWFEMEVARWLEAGRYPGRASFEKWTDSGRTLRLPRELGDIDYVGLSRDERLLVVVECKMVDQGLEPASLRNELHSFIRDQKENYADKFRKRIAWARANASLLCAAVAAGRREAVDFRPTHVAAVMVTRYPVFASYFITDFPCVALTEFAAAYDVKGRWPYPNGVWPVTDAPE
jgi:hypothetical protein